VPNAPPVFPKNLVDIVASLSLNVTSLHASDTANPIENGLIYLNKILESTLHLRVHEFLINSYIACVTIHEQVRIRFNLDGAMYKIKKKIMSVYENLLKWEVEVKQATEYRNNMLNTNTVPPPNTAAGLTGRRGGQDANLTSQGILGDQHGQFLSNTRETIDSQCNQIAESAPGTSSGQTQEDPYVILGIRSLEKGGNVTDWDRPFENKLIMLLGEDGLALTEEDEIIHLAEASIAGDLEEWVD
jgi:hypothetical protein